MANTDMGRASVRKVAQWLNSMGLNADIRVPYRSPFDLYCEGKRVEVKVCPRREDGIWQANIHRHGITDESNVDVYIIRLENVPEFKAAIHLVIPAPLKCPTVTISIRSLITRWSRYYNRLDFIKNGGNK